MGGLSFAKSDLSLNKQPATRRTSCSALPGSPAAPAPGQLMAISYQQVCCLLSDYTARPRNRIKMKTAQQIVGNNLISVLLEFYLIILNSHKMTEVEVQHIFNWKIIFKYFPIEFLPRTLLRSVADWFRLRCDGHGSID